MNMTGDPTQQNRPAVFGHDCIYPPISGDLNDWTKYPEAGPVPTYSYNPHQFSSAPPMLGNFSFTPSDRLPHPSQFNFVSNVSQSKNEHSWTTMRCKRKTDSPPLQIVKQHITEEKMAEHLSRLHISSETATSSCESEPLRERRLYMCEEMRRLQTDSILPQSLLSRIQRPCTALVLWTPPPPRVPDLQLENNNEESQPDNNHMDCGI